MLEKSQVSVSGARERSTWAISHGCGGLMGAEEVVVAVVVLDSETDGAGKVARMCGGSRP